MAPPPPNPIGYLLWIPIAVNLEDEAKVGSHSAKLISDNKFKL